MEESQHYKCLELVDFSNPIALKNRKRKTLNGKKKTSSNSKRHHLDTSGYEEVEFEY